MVNTQYLITFQEQDEYTVMHIVFQWSKSNDNPMIDIRRKLYKRMNKARQQGLHGSDHALYIYIYIYIK